ncbi:MAG: DNA-binding protein, partial [Planctomycetia bacterium]|nr:DNA-binding protein [Planctomycetia bacterium]
DDPLYAPRRGYPNPWVEIAVRTHLPLIGHRGQESLSRNHINVLTPTVLVALPGGPGTASEAALAVRYRRPIVAWLHDRGEIPNLPDSVPVAADLPAVQRFVSEKLGFASGTG